jgi:hypothetical protein
MKVLYLIDGDGLLFVNPYGSEKKGPYLPVGFLSDELQSNLTRLLQEVSDELQAATKKSTRKKAR